MATSTAQPPVVPYPESDELIHYGLRSLLIRASNNPHCLCRQGDGSGYWPVSKRIYPFSLDDFVPIYNSIVYPAILEILEAQKVMGELTQVHSICMGFKGDYVPVMLFIFRRISVSAAELVANAVADLLAREWSGPTIYVDVCEVRAGEAHDTHGSINWYEKYPFILRDPWLPGSSIGLASSKLTGTLSIFLSHGDEIYALTNHHVLTDEHGEIGQDSYRYAAGNPQLLVHAPSDSDWAATIESQRGAMKACRNRVQVLTGVVAAWEPKDQVVDRVKITEKRDQIDMYNSLIKAHEARIDDMKNFDREIGYVVLTSGCDAPAPDRPRQDWALVRCTKRAHRYRNQHRHVPDANLIDLYSVDRFLPKAFSEDELATMHDKWGMDLEWYSQTLAHFQDEAITYTATTRLPTTDLPAAFHPVTDPHYIKPPGARSGFEYAIRNSVKSINCEDSWGMSTEHIMINPMPRGVVTVKGDSGTTVLNKTYEVEFMSWGGINNIVQDLTFASFFPNILADIEKKAGWEAGSLVLLEAVGCDTK